MAEYRCANCSNEVAGSPFRSTCPRCGGVLVKPDQARAD